jgi:hypothetical protein
MQTGTRLRPPLRLCRLRSYCSNPATCIKQISSVPVRTKQIGSPNTLNTFMSRTPHIDSGAFKLARPCLMRL